MTPRRAEYINLEFPLMVLYAQIVNIFCLTAGNRIILDGN